MIGAVYPLAREMNGLTMVCLAEMEAAGRTLKDI